MANLDHAATVIPRQGNRRASIVCACGEKFAIEPVRGDKHNSPEWVAHVLEARRPKVRR